jgi:hypothetical protein
LSQHLSFNEKRSGLLGPSVTAVEDLLSATSGDANERASARKLTNFARKKISARLETGRNLRYRNLLCTSTTGNQFVEHARMMLFDSTNNCHRLLSKLFLI